MRDCGSGVAPPHDTIHQQKKRVTVFVPLIQQATTAALQERDAHPRHRLRGGHAHNRTEQLCCICCPICYAFMELEYDPTRTVDDVIECVCCPLCYAFKKCTEPPPEHYQPNSSTCSTENQQQQHGYPPPLGADDTQQFDPHLPPCQVRTRPKMVYVLN